MKNCVFTLVALLALVARANEAPPQYPPNAAIQYWRAFTELAEIPAEARKPLNHAFNAAPGKNRTELAARLSHILGLLNRGAKMSGADWGVDMAEGPNAEIPHAGKARELARAALLAAREEFDNGRHGEGLAILFNVLALGRHISRDGTLIGRLVEVAINTMALDALNQEVQRLPREELEKIELRFAALPPSTPLSENVKSERDMLEWFGAQRPNPEKAAILKSLVSGDDTDDKAELLRLFNSPEAMDAALRKLPPVYVEIETALAVPHSEFDVAWNKVNAAAANAGVLARWTRNSFVTLRSTLDRNDLQFALTRAGIRIALEGEKAVPTLRDPFGDGPLAYAKLPNGFQLTSVLIHNEKPTKALFGEAARKLPPPDLAPNPTEAIRPPAPPNPGDF